MVKQKPIEELESEITQRIGELDFIVNGLENYAPYQALTSSIEKTIKGIDDTWHLITDPKQYNELRTTKMAALEITQYIHIAKAELSKLREELVKLQNPDDFVNKDYDGE